MHKFLSCSQNEGGKSLLESVRGTSFRDVLKSCGSRFGIKTKKPQKTLRLNPERKTRLEPTLWAITRELYLYPRPLKGVFGVASCKLIILKSKRIALSYPFDFERKTRLELATPTLARLCSTN